MSGIDEIAAERKRQIELEGWTEKHDDQHKDRSLALVAALYATPIELFKVERCRNGGMTISDAWPWWSSDPDPQGRGGRAPSWDKRKLHDERRRLVIAGALLAAEIDRIDRADAKARALAETAVA